MGTERIWWGMQIDFQISLRQYRYERELQSLAAVVNLENFSVEYAEYEDVFLVSPSLIGRYQKAIGIRISDTESI